MSRKGLLKIMAFLLGLVGCLSSAQSAGPGAQGKGHEAVDFEASCSNPNVVRCWNFESEEQTRRHLDPAWDGTFRGAIVHDTAASGAGSLRFDVPSHATANSSGDFWLDFADDYSTQFGEGQEFFVQWRQKFDQSFLNSSAGDGWKQFIVGEGSRPGHTAYSCTDIHLVVTNAYNRGFPIMYHSCGFKGGTYEGLAPLLPNGGGDWLLQNAVGCKRSAPSEGCFRYAANEWMTFQMHVKIGHWYLNNKNYHRDSTVEFWIARQNQPSKLVISLTDYDLAHNNEEAPAAKYGKVWLLPYNTGREFSKQDPPGTTWYDDLIISRRRIPDPGTSVPNAPDALTASTGTSGIELTWRRNSNDEAGFRVERCTGAPYFCDYSQKFSQVATVRVGENHYSDNNARQNVAYTYRVRAYNAEGESAYSNDASNLPAPPSDLKAVVTSAGAVRLEWKDNSSDETQFSIERCTGQGCNNFSELARVAANVTTFSDTRAKDTFLSYRLRSLNAAGSWRAWDSANTAYSNPVSVSITH